MATKRHLIASDRIFSRHDLEMLRQHGQIWLWVGLILISTLIIISRNLAPSDSYEVGEICQNNIYYEGTTLTYTSEVQYNQAVETIKNQTADIYYLDETMAPQALENLEQCVAALANILNDESTDDKTEAYTEVLGDAYSSELTEKLSELGVNRLYQLETAATALIEKYYVPGVKDSEWNDTRLAIATAVAESKYNDAEKHIISALLASAKMKPNNIYDSEGTEALIQSKIDELRQVEVTVMPGQIVAEKGTPISADQLEMLDKTGLLEQRKGVGYYCGILGLVFVLYFLIFIYCRRYYPYYTYNRQGILIIGSLCLGYLLICQLILAATSSATGALFSVLGYFMPLPALAIIFAILASHRFSYFMVAVMALFMALMAMSQIGYLIVTLISSFFTVHLVQRVRERFQLIRFGVYIGALQAVLIALIGLVGAQNATTVGVGMLVGLAAGVVSAIIALGIIPITETYFGVITPMKLMELANPGQPLIRRLITEAPGTYYHSILVGNLAEAAADAVGADSLLVRVASYFHDVGKLTRPGYFTENQEPGQNPHERLSTTLSALIITSHVKDGVALAEENQLPEAIVRIVREHHGDTVVRYFYHKAVELEGKENVDISLYTYEGPKPQSRESAIIMMADSVQAATQSMSEGTRADVENKIHEIIQGQLASGQFEECDLTFRDLHKIEEAFVSVLAGLSHYRIAYPDVEDEDVSLLAGTLKTSEEIHTATRHEAATEDNADTEKTIGETEKNRRD